MLPKKALQREEYQSDNRYRTLTREEVAWLIEASNAPYEAPEPKPLDLNYPTYSREDVALLLQEHFEYKEEQKRRKKEWDSQKTTESEEKIAPKTKRSKRSKD
jgi:hypothetical protein